MVKWEMVAVPVLNVLQMSLLIPGCDSAEKELALGCMDCSADRRWAEIHTEQ